MRASLTEAAPRTEGETSGARSCDLPDEPHRAPAGRDGAPDALGPAVRLSRDTNSPASDRLHSVRAFHLHGENGAPLARVVTAQPLGSRLSGRPAVYEVRDPAGAPLGRITLRRRRAFRAGRRRWTVEPVAGQALRGYDGRLLWWALWRPVGLPFSLV